MPGELGVVADAGVPYCDDGDDRHGLVEEGVRVPPQHPHSDRIAFQSHDELATGTADAVLL